MKNNEQKDRVRGSLIGGAIGDALGFPVEFIDSYEEIQMRYGENGITRLDTGHRWTKTNMDKAVISDASLYLRRNADGKLMAYGSGIVSCLVCNGSEIEERILGFVDDTEMEFEL